MRRVLALVGFVLAFLAAGARAQAPAPDPGGALPYDARILFDRAQGQERQREEAERVRTAAKQGDAHAQYLLGTLYRLGMHHPAKVFERDDEKAWIYLSNAATGGQLYAMAAAAELELGRKRWMEAMVWAQAYTHYEALLVNDPDSGQTDSQPYAAYLIQRAFEELGRSDEVRKQIAEHLGAFVQAYDEKVRNGLLQHGPQYGSGAPLKQQFEGKRYFDDFLSKEEQRLKTPGWALFLIGVDGKGTIKKAIVIDTLPDEVMAEGVALSASHMTFNPIANDAPMRWTIMPISFDNGYLGLKQTKKK